MKGKNPCNESCSYFRCGQRALYIKNAGQQRDFSRNSSSQDRTNRDEKAFCNWVGDVCVVAGCNYAFCERRALLPDGSCGLEERDDSKQVKSIEEEAKKEEILVRSAREKLVKKKGFDFVE